MNRILLWILTISLLLLIFIGLISLQTKVALIQKEGSVSFHNEKKESYGEGEYTKAKLNWDRRNRELFQKIMTASTGRNEIILLREYKSLMEEIQRYIEELNGIEPPIPFQKIHLEMISLHQYAYQTCRTYFQDYRQHENNFRKYVTLYFRLYPLSLSKHYSFKMAW